jgi:hypothetical protein
MRRDWTTCLSIFIGVVGPGCSDHATAKEVESPQQSVLATGHADNTLCDAALWQRVYKPNRLKTVDICKTVTGVVQDIAPDEDGDMHAVLMLDPGQESLINKRNQKKKNGGLVIEIVCSAEPKSPRAAVRTCSGYHASLAMPPAGTHARVTGSYVIDTHNGWAEIHPVSRIELIK